MACRNIQPQDWVIIMKGIYRQDLGCVTASHEWGLDVLVIPRLFPADVQGRKTKAQTVQGFNQIHSITKPAPNCKPEFDRGLLVLECEHLGVQRASTAPVSTLGLFNQSQHPVVLNALKRLLPLETTFAVSIIVEKDSSKSRTISVSHYWNNVTMVNLIKLSIPPKGPVRDVICGQKNESGLAVIIILDNYDPASTNKEYAVDYADVLDVETGRPFAFRQAAEAFPEGFYAAAVVSHLPTRRETSLLPEKRSDPNP
ncbi:hypothetical protein IW261DRAFT_1423903 [Armillaria novae-zelandiae]|uniref:Uncharacterized protein n=1 Tax=Armillaria novae-zelandiae TaxID=153914 RepID=A0AA39NW04_9AGAR|nr:hypothetical protein IW261DRAFT_1423903 [Armillaria novae-zelandiae]